MQVRVGLTLQYMRKRREDKGTKQAGTVSVDECMKRNARDGIGDIGLGKR